MDSFRPQAPAWYVNSKWSVAPNRARELSALFCSLLNVLGFSVCLHCDPDGSDSDIDFLVGADHWDEAWGRDAIPRKNTGSRKQDLEGMSCSLRLRRSSHDATLAMSAQQTPPQGPGTANLEDKSLPHHSKRQEQS